MVIAPAAKDYQQQQIRGLCGGLGMDWVAANEFIAVWAIPNSKFQIPNSKFQIPIAACFTGATARRKLELEWWGCWRSFSSWHRKQAPCY